MRWAALLVLVALPAAASTVTGYSRHGERVVLKLDDGTAAVEWISNRAFRFTRGWLGTREPAPNVASGTATISVSDTGQAVRFSSDHLVVLVRKRGLQVSVTEPDGTPLVADLSEAVRREGAIEWERSAPDGVRYYGLGGRGERSLNLRGQRVVSRRPLLLASSGYGELHVAGGRFTFDLAESRPDRYRIRAEGADAVDYYFVYGPSPKETLEELTKAVGSISRLRAEHYSPLPPQRLPSGAVTIEVPATWEGLARLVRWQTQAGMSAELLPAWDLRPFLDAPSPLKERALQLASVAPLLIWVWLLYDDG